MRAIIGDVSTEEKKEEGLVIHSSTIVHVASLVIVFHSIGPFQQSSIPF